LLELSSIGGEEREFRLLASLKTSSEDDSRVVAGSESTRADVENGCGLDCLDSGGGGGSSRSSACGDGDGDDSGAVGGGGVIGDNVCDSLNEQSEPNAGDSEKPYSQDLSLRGIENKEVLGEDATDGVTDSNMSGCFVMPGMCLLDDIAGVALSGGVTKLTGSESSRLESQKRVATNESDLLCQRERDGLVQGSSAVRGGVLVLLESSDLGVDCLDGDTCNGLETDLASVALQGAEDEGSDLSVNVTSSLSIGESLVSSGELQAIGVGNEASAGLNK
jgi:hypothetical protein